MRSIRDDDLTPARRQHTDDQKYMASTSFDRESASAPT